MMPFRRLQAREADQTAARWASVAGDSRQEGIADVHVVEVSWKELVDISADEAMKRLAARIDTLRTFRGQAWPLRVLRDALALLYDIQSTRQMPEAAATIESAWKVATEPPLGGSPRGRCAAVDRSVAAARDRSVESIAMACRASAIRKGSR